MVARRSAGPSTRRRRPQDAAVPATSLHVGDGGALRRGRERRLDEPDDGVSRSPGIDHPLTRRCRPCGSHAQPSEGRLPSPSHAHPLRRHGRRHGARDAEQGGLRAPRRAGSRGEDRRQRAGARLPVEELPRRRRDQGPDHPLRRQPHGPRRHARAQRARRAGCSRRTSSAYFDKVVHFEPDAVISDFDSFAYLFAKRHGLPVLSIDNQQIISRCKHGKFAKEGAKVDYQMTKAFVRAKLPAATTTSSRRSSTRPSAPSSENDTTLVPPILRKIDPRREEEGARSATTCSSTRRRPATRSSSRAQLASKGRSSWCTASGRTPARATARSRSSARTASSTTWRARAPSWRTAGCRSSARPCTWASRSSACRCATSTSRSSTRATSRSSATASAPSRSRPTSSASSCDEAPKYAARVGQAQAGRQPGALRRGRRGAPRAWCAGAAPLPRRAQGGSSLASSRSERSDRREAAAPKAGLRRPSTAGQL
jgi:hypothetical protein